MPHYQIQIPCGHLPVALILTTDGSIAFRRHPSMGTLIDQPEHGVGAVFKSEGFYIGEGVMYEWGVPYMYKELPEMLQWLQQQHLTMPELT